MNGLRKKLLVWLTSVALIAGEFSTAAMPVFAENSMQTEELTNSVDDAEENVKVSEEAAYELLTANDFKDKALYAALKDVLGEDKMTSDDLAGMQILQIKDDADYSVDGNKYYGIKSLEDIAEKMPALEKLQINNEDISSIDPLMGMEKLTYVYLEKNDISKLPDDMSGCKWTVLNLNGNLLTEEEIRRAKVPETVNLLNSYANETFYIGRRLYKIQDEAMPFMFNCYRCKLGKYLDFELTIDGKTETVCPVMRYDIYYYQLAIPDVRTYFPGLEAGTHQVMIQLKGEDGKTIARSEESAVTWSDEMLFTEEEEIHQSFYPDFDFYYADELAAGDVSANLVNAENESWKMDIEIWEDAENGLAISDMPYYDKDGHLTTVSINKASKIQIYAGYDPNLKGTKKKIVPGDYTLKVSIKGGEEKAFTVHYYNFPEINQTWTGVNDQYNWLDCSDDEVYVVLRGDRFEAEKIKMYIASGATVYAESYGEAIDRDGDGTMLYTLKKNDNWAELEAAEDDSLYEIRIVYGNDEYYKDCRNDYGCKFVRAGDLKYNAAATLINAYLVNRTKTLDVFFTENSVTGTKMTVKLYRRIYDREAHEYTGEVFAAEGSGEIDKDKHIAFSLKDADGNDYYPPHASYFYELTAEGYNSGKRDLEYDEYSYIEYAGENEEDNVYFQLADDQYYYVKNDSEKVSFRFKKIGTKDPGKVYACLYNYDEEGDNTLVGEKKELIAEENGIYSVAEWSRAGGFECGKYWLTIDMENVDGSGKYEDAPGYDRGYDVCVVDDRTWIRRYNVEFANKEDTSFDPTCCKLNVSLISFEAADYQGEAAIAFLQEQGISLEVYETDDHEDDTFKWLDVEIKAARVSKDGITFYLSGLGGNGVNYGFVIKKNGEVLQTPYRYYTVYDDDENVTYGLNACRGLLDEDSTGDLKYVKTEDKAFISLSAYSNDLPYTIRIYEYGRMLKPIKTITISDPAKVGPDRLYDITKEVEGLDQNKVYYIAGYGSGNARLETCGYLMGDDSIYIKKEEPKPQPDPDPNPNPKPDTEEEEEEEETPAEPEEEDPIPTAAPGMNLLLFYVKGELYETMQVKTGDVAGSLKKGDPQGKFIGWFTDGKKLWDPTAPVTTDLKLIARFAPSSASENKTGESAIDSQVSLDGTALYLVKGQKFDIGEGWTSSEPSVLSISKGKGKAKASGKAVLKKDGTPDIVVTVTVPEMKSKKMTVYAGGKEEKANFSFDEKNYKVYWDSDTPDVAKVSDDGYVYGIAKGKAVISAYINGIKYSCKVTVKEADTAKRDWNSEVKLVPLQKIKYNAAGFKASAAEWSSVSGNKGQLKNNEVVNDGIVSITKKGVITAVGAGSTTINVKYGNVERKLKITVAEPAPTVLHMSVKSNKKIKPYGVSGKVQWKSDNTTVVSTDTKRIMANATGCAHLTYEYGNFTYKMTVYVEDLSLEAEELYGGKVSLTKSGKKYKLTMKKGSTGMLKMKGVSQKILFKSSDDSKAFVDEAGIVSARNTGKTKLSAKLNGKTISISVIVEE